MFCYKSVVYHFVYSVLSISPFEENKNEKQKQTSTMIYNISIKVM